MLEKIPYYYEILKFREIPSTFLMYSWRIHIWTFYENEVLRLQRVEVYKYSCRASGIVRRRVEIHRLRMSILQTSVKGGVRGWKKYNIIMKFSNSVKYHPHSSCIFEESTFDLFSKMKFWDYKEGKCMNIPAAHLKPFEELWKSTYCEHRFCRLLLQVEWEVGKNTILLWNSQILRITIPIPLAFLKNPHLNFLRKLSLETTKSRSI